MLAFSGAQALELEDCRISAGPGQPGVKARCGTMLRPENPDDPASESIEIRVAVVPALNLSPETDAIVPTVSGRAWITGTHQLMLDPDDPWPEGYRIADTWPVT